MRPRDTGGPLRDERGMALPLAIVTLLILTALIIGFSVLGSTEPTIASNHLMAAQARAAAEAGLERAIWALGRTNPDGTAKTNGIPTSFGTAPAPYNGSQLVSLSRGADAVGGFRVTVYPGAHAPECPGPLAAAERCIVSVGWIPTDSGLRPKAHQKLVAVVFNPRLAFRDPPAALSVRGELELGGTALIDARSDQSCGSKIGALSLGATNLQGDAANVWGATDGNDTRNEVTDAGGSTVPAGAHDIVENTAPSVFDGFVLSNADIDALRTYARSHGTYLQGAVTFTSGNLPNGVVFVDTVSGANITAEGVTPATPSSEFASVEIHGNAPAGLDGDGVFHGWLFVNGTVQVSGGFQMHGLIYSQDDIVYTGSGGVSGAMVSRNIRGTSSTRIHSDLNGNSVMRYNCADAKTGGGTIPDAWSLRAGSYKELSGS